MQYGKWEVIRPLGRQGGQGAAYLVSDINELQLSTLYTQLSNSITALGGFSYAEDKASQALAVLRLIENYL